MKALILAAGRGERLRPLTDHLPKPLLQAGGKPLIQHTIESLVRHGFHDIVVNLAWQGARLRAFLGDGRHLAANLAYSDEGEEALETGGGIRHALPLLGDGPFLVVNGDIATDYPFSRLRTGPEREMHLVLVPNPAHHPLGDFALRADGLLTLNEPRYTFGGIGVYRPERFAALAEGRFPLAPILRAALAETRVTGELHPGWWMDIGTRDRLAALDARLRAAPLT